MPTLRLPASLSHYAGSSAALQAAGATVGEVLAETFRHYPELQVRLLDDRGRVHPHLAVFVGKAQLRREEIAGTPVGPDDTITFLVAVEGG